jgi:hypothetical protein
MHNDSDTPYAEQRSTDPLRFAPPPGCWVLWHGPHAERAIDLARQNGRPVSAVPGLPQRPAGLPPPSGERTGAWLLESGGRRFYVEGEVHNRYVSCHLCHLPDSGQPGTA